VICPQDPTLCVALGLLRSLGARGLDDAAAPRQTSRPQVPAGVTTLVSAPPTEAEEETAENAVGSTVAGPQRSESAALLAADRLAARTRVTVNELSKRFRFTRKSNGVRNGPHTASSVSEAVDPEIGELTDLSGRYCSSGRFTEATTCANAALVRAQRLGDAGGKAAALLALASASQAAGGQDRAVGYLHEAVDVAGAAGHLTTEATALAMLARLYYQASEPDKALFYAHAALATETAAPGLEELAGLVHDLEADVAAGRGEPSGSQASGRSHENSDR
jgi:tetratricopeptide (TPR) repeat protein